MTFNEFFSQLSSIGAEQIDFRGVVLAGGRVIAIRQMSFKLPVLKKTIVASVGCVESGEYFQLTPAMTLIKEPNAEAFISQIQDVMFGECTGAVYGAKRAY